MESDEYVALQATLFTLTAAMTRHGLEAEAFIAALQATSNQLRAAGKERSAELIETAWSQFLPTLALLDGNHGSPQ